MTARFVVGDVFEVLATIPDSSVDLVLTSPPFLALRSYLPADHPDKAKEIGSESTPADYLDTLLELTAEWSRVLAPHGSIAVELGDTYAGSGGAGGDYADGGLRDGQERFDGSASRTRHDGKVFRGGERQPHKQGAAWPLDKSLCGIPTLYAWSLAYGRNLLTGETSPAGMWRVRNLVAWVRPNPPVGALADKYRPATSYITVATRARDRWFDLDAVRTPLSAKTLTVTDGTPPSTKNNGSPSGHHRQDRLNNHAGAPPLDWWEITPGGYSGAHYAVWPKGLVKRLTDSMCPRRVCVTCREPSRRITERTGSLDPSRPQSRRAMELADTAGLTDEHIAAIRSYGIHDAGKAKVTQNGAGRNSERVKRLAEEAKAALGGYFREFLLEVPQTTGWSDCGCPGDHWRPGLVLDPFVGSGTTLEVATGMGRDAIGIDLDERNADLARERVGMFITVDHHQEATV